ncbi:hypothetical protein NPIL_629641 [Nephila pilipes]|uniref:Uncharacterized protein n=1 Tax=Nephila pilipes TaxID=299642 RepID=A0A8X6QDT3_NEPPI|nr:hypothetical protein NPIL_629641 [Nephila pilipes]
MDEEFVNSIASMNTSENELMEISQDMQNQSIDIPTEDSSLIPHITHGTSKAKVVSANVDSQKEFNTEAKIVEVIAENSEEKSGGKTCERKNKAPSKFIKKMSKSVDTKRSPTKQSRILGLKKNYRSKSTSGKIAVLKHQLKNALGSRYKKLKARKSSVVRSITLRKPKTKN